MTNSLAWAWIGNQLDNYFITDEPSLWKELLLNQNVKIGENFSKRSIYISGEPEIVHEMLDLFSKVPEKNKVTFLTEQDNKHPALLWMDIYYYPPELVKELPYNHVFTIFLNNRIPIWARKLVVNKKVKRFVTKEVIEPLKNYDEYEVEYETISEFNYEILLKASLIRMSNINEQLFADIPNQLKVQLIKSNGKDYSNIFDRIANYMLNEYWLLNKPDMHQWIKILLNEVEQYLFIRDSDTTKEEKLDALEEWGYRDKTINRIRK